MGFVFTPGKRAAGLTSAYLFGSSLTNSGAGPFAIGGGNEPFPQWWRYVGTAAVTLTLPNATTPGTISPAAWLVVAGNDGSGGASVQVEDYATNVIDTLAIGEVAMYGWNEALLTWDIVGKWGASGGGFVNPMPNNSPLQGLLVDGVTVEDIAKITTGNQLFLGSSTIATRLNSFSVGGLLINGSNSILWSAVGIYSVTDLARSLGILGNRWGGVYNGGLHSESFTVASGSSGYVVTANDATVVFTQTNASPQFLGLPNPTSPAVLGRKLHIRNAVGSTGALAPTVTGGSALIGSTGNITPGQWRVYASNGTNWYEVAAG